MYKQIEVDDAKTSKWFAAADAQEKDRQNRGLWSKSKQAELDAFYLRVCAAYNARVFRNYRQKFMVVKVDKPTKGCLLAQAVRELDYDAAQMGIDIVRTRNNILYRLK